jgi:HipA-like protein
MDNLKNQSLYIYLKGSYIKCAHLSFKNDQYEFEYDKLYLKRKDAIAIDPLNLPLFEKNFKSETIFGAIKDCSPDRWGHYLLEKILIVIYLKWNIYWPMV